MKSYCDILVVGGGVAGLAATAALASTGRRVICIDRAPAEAGMADTRTTAFLRPAVDLLYEAGAWFNLKPEAAALNVMRLIDAGGRENAAREIADFTAEEIGEPPFGWNVTNAAVRLALMARISELPGAELRTETALEGLIARRAEAFARLSDGATIVAKLVVAADGRTSAAREFARIGVRRWDYGQKALVFTVAHEFSHFGVSTEVHRSGGPFTLVPIPDGEDGHRSSVVWMEKAGEADRLADLPVPEFEAELNERALGVLGPLKLISGRAAWPIISMLADRLTERRVALVAEAAHVVPPIGAQGLNMSLGDISALKAAIGDDPGADDGLAIYQRRWPELAARVTGIDALNRAALSETQSLRDIRRIALAAISRTPPVRQAAMRLGLAARAMAR